MTVLPCGRKKVRHQFQTTPTGRTKVPGAPPNDGAKPRNPQGVHSCPHGSLAAVARSRPGSSRLGELDRRVVSLAVPAFLALVVEPLFLLADSAIVGHLGTTELAAMAIASVVLRAAVGVWIFLAYGTTAAVARHIGAGDR